MNKGYTNPHLQAAGGNEMKRLKYFTLSGILPLCMSSCDYYHSDCMIPFDPPPQKKAKTRGKLFSADIIVASWREETYFCLWTLR